MPPTPEPRRAASPPVIGNRPGPAGPVASSNTGTIATAGLQGIEATQAHLHNRRVLRQTANGGPAKTHGALPANRPPNANGQVAHTNTAMPELTTHPAPASSQRPVSVVPKHEGGEHEADMAFAATHEAQIEHEAHHEGEQTGADSGEHNHTSVEQSEHHTPNEADAKDAAHEADIKTESNVEPTKAAGTPARPATGPLARPAGPMRPQAAPAKK